MNVAFLLCLFAFAMIAAPAAAQKEPPAEAAKPRVVLETSKGKVVLELEPDKAPKTVANFLTYVREGFFDGTVFHRVIPGFVIQGGGFTAEMVQKKTHDPIPNEADNGLKNLRGTISMARTPDPDSATSQFFISVADNASLDHTGKNPRGWGYAVFGRVVEGMDAVDAIVGVRTGRRGPYSDVPVEPVTLVSAKVEGK
jgi:peptidyl-prolyl cis-trans isomerase B (cyclophilin B)